MRVSGQFEIQNPDYIQVVQASFARQGLLRHINAVLVSVEPGVVTIELPITEEVSQQHGFVHAGAVTSIVDSACGYAALTLMPPDSKVLSVEFKINFLRPAAGVKLIAEGQVLKPGRTITVCRGEVYALDEAGMQALCAVMQATMIRK